MHHAALVRRREAGAELARDLERLVFRQPADPPEQRRQILAVHVLHRQDRLPVHFADVVHAADVRMRHLPRRPHFVVELRQLLRIALAILAAGISAPPTGPA